MSNMFIFRPKMSLFIKNCSQNISQLFKNSLLPILSPREISRVEKEKEMMQRRWGPSVLDRLSWRHNIAELRDTFLMIGVTSHSHQTTFLNNIEHPQLRIDQKYLNNL